MSIYFSGTFTRSAGLPSAISKQLKLVNLKPVKRVQIQFDPFHPKAKTVRDFLFFVSSPKITATNLNCAIRTNIVCDRSEPWIKVDLLENKTIRFLAEDLSTLEILQQFNKHISSKVKPEEESPAKVTKIDQKKQKRK